MNTTRFAIAAACCLPLPAVARAQATPDTAHVPAVVVTATRTPLQVDRVPASVSILTGAELRAQGIVHLADALRAVPGFTVVQSGSYGAPATAFVRGGQGNYTKVLIDGVPANEPGGAFDFGTLTVDDVERVEIVRGPASVAWGSDAVSAVVHIITRRGVADRALITARGGTYGTSDVSASLERGSPRWRGALSAGHHASRGTYDFNSGYRNALVGGSATWARGAATTLRVNARHGNMTAHFPTDFTGAPVDPNAFRREMRTIASAELAQAIGGVHAVLTAGHSHVVGSSVDPANGADGTSTSFDTRSRREQVELRADAPLAPWLVLTGGGIVEGQHRAGAFNSVTTASGTPDARDRQATGGDRTNRGAYAELLASGQAATATLGARVDNSATYGTFGTYRVAVTQSIRRGTRLRASIGTGFREPSFDEVLPSAFSTGNANLEPERTTSWEVGAEQRLVAGRVVVGATYFQQQFRNMIDYFSQDFPGRYENVAAARARGTELEARVVPARGWLVDGSLTLVRTRVETAGFGGSFADGRSLLRRPARSATAGASYTARRGTAALRLAHVGARDDVRFYHDAPYSAEERLPAYTKVDLSGELPVAVRAVRGVALTLRVENVGGARYETAAGYRAPGRAFLAGARAQF